VGSRPEAREKSARVLVGECGKVNDWQESIYQQNQRVIK
jgi:hypothetical protein